MSLLDDIDEFEELTIDTKRCSRCGHVLRIEEFSLDDTRRDGHYAHCRVCHADTVRARYWKIKRKESTNT